MRIPVALKGRRVEDCGEPFASHPLFALALAFSIGICAAEYLHLELFVVLIGAALLTITAGILLLKIRSRRLATAMLLIVVCVLGESLAASENELTPASQLRTLLIREAIAPGETVEITGVLTRDPEEARGSLYLQLRVETVRSHGVTSTVNGVVLLFAPIAAATARQEYVDLTLRYGARLRVMTTLERTNNFRNPGVSSFTEYLDRQGYDATGFVKSPLLIERLNDERIFLPLAWLYEWRRKLQTEIDARFSVETAGVLDAALLGNRYNLSKASSMRFRNGGTFHILVISGLHITLLGGLIYYLSGWLTRKRSLRFVVSALVLWAYSVAVGAESSVVRSALMFTLVLFGSTVFRHASSLNTLGGSALILLALKPAQLFDPSFQLTFASVFALVVCAWPLLKQFSQIGAWHPGRATPHPPACAQWLRSFCEALYWNERNAKEELAKGTCSYRLFKSPWAARLERWHVQRPLRYAFEALLVSAMVQLILLPFLIVYFHRLSFASLLLNIWVSFLLTTVALCAFVALIIVQLSATVAAPLIKVTNFLDWLMVRSVDPFAHLHLASIRLPEYTGAAFWIYLIYYVPLIMLLLLLWSWRPFEPTNTINKRVEERTGRNACPTKTCVLRCAVLMQFIAIVLVVWHPFSAGRSTGTLRVDFLDVGQGDSAFVTFPDDTTMLIDGGGSPGPFRKSAADADLDETFERDTRSIGEAVVSEYLWWRGLDRVDYILATHADADHIDGLNDVARNFTVGAALVARAPDNDEEFGRFNQTLTDEKIPLRLIGAGDVLRFGQVAATVLWPPPSGNPNLPSRNDDSLVVQLQFGARSILLTGDVEKSGEQGILSSETDLRADVIKVAHHGSKTSSTQGFVDHVHPEFAVISVGQTSIFGHPNAEVVKRWRDRGAQVLTTGNSGTITVITDGRALDVKTFVP